MTAASRQTLLVVALLLRLVPAGLAEACPRWLRYSDVTTNWAFTNDYAAANLGQLKWFATNACNELEAHLPRGAGTGLWAMVWSFPASNHDVGVNMGQVKSVARTVYARLIEEGYTNEYPWTDTATDDQNRAAANLGQLKSLFSFDLRADDDSDRISDWWENHWFGDTNETAEGDFDEDGLNNLEEYTALTDPTDIDSDDDGTRDGAEADAGTDPRDVSSCPRQISGEISYSGYLAGTIHVVAQTISDGWTTDCLDSVASPGAYSIANVANLMNYWIKAWRDTDGDGGNDYWEPVGYYAGNPVSLTTNISGIDITLTSPTNDLDADGLPDWWEIRCFGDTTLQAALDDADFDSANNAAEYGIGSDPTDGALYVNGTSGNDTNSGAFASPFQTIQGGIGEVGEGGVLVVMPGKYTGIDTNGLDFGGTNLMLYGLKGAANTFILCPDHGRAFVFHSGETSASLLSGFTIWRGDASYGAGILCDSASPRILSSVIAHCEAALDGGGMCCLNGASPVIRDCVFSENTAHRDGGAIHSSSPSGSTFIEWCRFEQNVSDGHGGAICVQGGKSTVADSLFSRNVAFRDGGGVYCSNANVLVTGCTLSENGASYHGGGLCWQSSPESKVFHCLITDNQAVDGAGIALDRSDIMIDSCIVRNNCANRCGGGVSCQYAAPTIANCLVSDNRAYKYGGGVACISNAPARIVNCTVIWNDALKSGGGLYADGSSPTSYNCIYWGNKANKAAQEIDSTLIGSAPAIEWCDVGNWTNGGVGNITNDPRLATSSYRLNADSPCIDAGASNAITAAVAFDIEGNARWDDPGCANATSSWDVGCYEFVDKDANRMPDAWEEQYLSGTKSASRGDVDGVTNAMKCTGQAISISFDTDGDGLSDHEETKRYGTSPTDPDSDDDGMLDGYEVGYSFNPTNAADALEDVDGDRVVNGIEAVSGTCPTSPVFPYPPSPNANKNKIDPSAQRPKERFPGQTIPRQRNSFLMPL